MCERGVRKIFTIKKSIKLILSLTVALCMAVSASAQELVAGGEAVGIRMSTDGVVVASLASVETEAGTLSPAADAGFKPGDIIIKFGDAEIHSADDFISCTQKLDGSEVNITLLRNGKTKQIKISPARATDGSLRLGLMLRNEISGVGTLTFYDPEKGVYGALGHSISDPETNEPLPLLEGDIYNAEIVSIVPGTAGTPGELDGVSDTERTVGDIQINCDCGIFGAAEPQDGSTLETGEMHEGEASLLCTLNGTQVGEYKVRITKVGESGGVTVATLRITDEALLSSTGGIVQGMSGSPILQDGKLVGAVTHVLVNDPASGYGISIYDMLNAAEDCKAA